MKKAWAGSDGSECLRQALCSVMGISGHKRQLPKDVNAEVYSYIISQTHGLEKLELRLARLLFRRGRAIIAWSDKKGRDKNDVACMLDSLAYKLERKAGKAQKIVRLAPAPETDGLDAELGELVKSERKGELIPV